VSVGGRYSNHLHALAWACQAVGLESVGLVLGYPAQALTPTLIDCQNWGMRLHFVDRQEYQGRYDDAFWHRWLALYPNAMRLNEGAWSPESMAGSALWWQGIAAETERVICAVGSGCTLAGLAINAPPGTQVVGVPVFRDAENYRDLHAKLASLAPPLTEYQLWTDFAGPGFGRLSPEQRNFSRAFTEESGITLDPVYTAKVFYALAAHLAMDPELGRQKIAILHTGGLQGCRQ